MPHKRKKKNNKKKGNKKTYKKATIPKETSLTNWLLLASETVYPAKIHPHVPAAPIKPNHFFDSEGFKTPTAIPQNKTMGKMTVTSQIMYEKIKTVWDLKSEMHTIEITVAVDRPKVAICMAPKA